MKQTAVEWLVYVVQSNIAPNYIPKEIIKQAKEMEKEQITMAHMCGGYGEKEAEEYFSKTFKLE